MTSALISSRLAGDRHGTGVVTRAEILEPHDPLAGSDLDFDSRFVGRGHDLLTLPSVPPILLAPRNPARFAINVSGRGELPRCRLCH